MIVIAELRLRIGAVQVPASRVAASAGDNRDAAIASSTSSVRAPRWRRASRRWPRPLVFTNGVFDILHRGHVSYLAQARALGASLVVGLNSDASARALGKGAGSTR